MGASLSDAALANTVADAVLDAGDYQQTYRWADIGAVEISQYPATATKELAAVLAADIFIGLLPGRLGMATELGAALAARPAKRVIMWASEDYFYQHAQDGFHPSVFLAHPRIVRLVGGEPAKTIVAYLKGDSAVRTFSYATV